MQHENAHESGITESDVNYLSPYEMLLNDDGIYASNIYNYNPDAIALLDLSNLPYSNLSYNMLQEARNRDQRTTNTSWRAQIGLKINIIDGLTFNSKFQYEQNKYKRRNYYTEESFYTRFLVDDRSSLYSRPTLYGCTSSDGTGGVTMDSEYYTTMTGSSAQVNGAPTTHLRSTTI